MKAEPGSSPSRSEGGRRKSLRLTLLLLTIAALLLVPAAQAFAAPSMKVNITGTGSGEVISSGEEGGAPSIDCSYNGSTKSGVCENEPGEVKEGEGFT